MEPVVPAEPEAVETPILDELNFEPVEEEPEIPVDTIPEPVAAPGEDAEIFELRDKMAQLEKELAGMTEPAAPAEPATSLETPKPEMTSLQEMIEEMSAPAAAEEAAPEIAAVEEVAEAVPELAAVEEAAEAVPELATVEEAAEAAPESTAAKKAAAAATAAAAVAAPVLAAKAAEAEEISEKTPAEALAETPAQEPPRRKTNKELRKVWEQREKEKREQEKREKAERKAQKNREKAERTNRPRKAAPEAPKAEETKAPAKAEEAKTPAKAETKAAEATKEAPAEAAEAPEKAKKKHGVLKGILIALAILALIGVLVFELLLGIVHVNDNAMAGSVRRGSYLLYSRLDKLPSTNDLVVFKNVGGKTCVRRMIARGGDTITFDKYANQIKVNKKAIPNVPEDVDWWGIDMDYDFPITVQDDEVFVLSGNREDPSNEGLIDKDSIKGKAIWIF